MSGCGGSRLARLGPALALAAAVASPSGAEPPQPSVSARPPAAGDFLPAGPGVEERLAEIQRRVQAVADYPSTARLREVEGETLVEFEIDARGRPESLRTARSSGSLALDRAASRAVKRAAPLPFVYGRVQVPVRFTLRDPRSQVE